VRRGALVLALLGCGPNVAADDGSADATGTDTTGASSTQASSTNPTGSLDTTVGTVTTTDGSTTDPTDGGNDGAYEEDSGGTGCAFTCPPAPGSGGGGGGFGECDLVAQDCPEGEKCMPWANDGGAVWNSSRCSPLDPDPNAPGEPCNVEGSGVSGIDDCSAGAMCFEVDPETNIGVCRGFCLAGLEPCAGGDACFVYAPNYVELCVEGCDPLAPECPDPSSCVPEQQGFVCVPGMGAAIGEACSAPHDCASGSVCISGDLLPDCTELACCTALCDVTAMNPCGGGETCVAWDEDAAPPWDHVGACVGG